MGYATPKKRTRGLNKITPHVLQSQPMRFAARRKRKTGEREGGSGTYPQPEHQKKGKSFKEKKTAKKKTKNSTKATRQPPSQSQKRFGKIGNANEPSFLSCSGESTQVTTKHCKESKKGVGYLFWGFGGFWGVLVWVRGFFCVCVGACGGGAGGVFLSFVLWVWFGLQPPTPPPPAPPPPTKPPHTPHPPPTTKSPIRPYRNQPHAGGKAAQL